MASNIAEILASNYSYESESDEEEISEDFEADIPAEIKKIVQNKLNEKKSTSMLSDFLKKPGNYLSDFEIILYMELEGNKEFKDELESKVASYRTSISGPKGIEYGERGPQGNRTSFVPMGELVFCTQCGPEHAVKLRTKGQRCPIHNKELKKLKNSKSENLL
ncbi:hypothetical protein [Methanosarcina sp.]|uniref:hypothetical protein n=1 Tax=Methanosarcina sp. TaxID=2213 RepID=UPI003C75FA7C